MIAMKMQNASTLMALSVANAKKVLLVMAGRDVIVLVMSVCMVTVQTIQTMNVDVRWVGVVLIVV